MRERLQKILASAGVASRREAEELIRSGKVYVNGRRITEMGYQADAAKDTIVADGQRVRTEPLRTIMLNKPRGVLTTMDDPEGRDTVAELVRDEPVRLFPVGRLDRRSEGLLLMTNDGELAQLLTHPRYGVSKIYHLEVSRQVADEDLRKLERGVQLEDGPTLPTRVEALEQKMGFWYKMTISEGRNRQIRRMFAALGYYVMRLRRVQVGSLRIGDLKPGAKRQLTRMELERLRASAGAARKGEREGGSKPGSSQENHRHRSGGGGPARGLERSPSRGTGDSARAKRPRR